MNLKLYGPKNTSGTKHPHHGRGSFLLMALLSGMTLVFGPMVLSGGPLFLGFPLTGGAIGLTDDLIKYSGGRARVS